MSPHPSMSTPATPQHNPFASSPAAPAQPTITQHTPIKPATESGGGGGSGSGGSGGRVGSGSTGTLAKFGNMLKVRCKSTTAVLNASKYESGSKGKCIQGRWIHQSSLSVLNLKTYYNQINANYN